MRRRLLITIAASAALLLVAAVSLAAWLSLQETAPSSFTAASASSRVDLGNAEIASLFSVSGMQPGDQVEACFRAAIDLNTDSIDPATVARLYSGGVGGTGLAEHLLITIIRDDPNPVSLLSTGIFDCHDFTGSTNLVANELLSSYATSTPIFAAGDSLGTLTARAVNKVDIRVVMTLPPTAPPAASGLNATTSWIVEDQ